MTAIQSPARGVLTSDWSGLSPHLLASFFPVHKVEDGRASRWERVPGSAEVQAPLTEGRIEVTQNWNSPFEQTGAEARFASLSAQLQTGSFAAIANALGQNFESGLTGADLTSQAGEALGKLAGLSGVTKLNSQQVFTGSPPTKLSFTAHFRALFDAAEEVEQPVAMLTGWAMPKKLAPDGVIANTLRDGPGVRTVYGSEIPQIIGMRYARGLWKPMVIEQVSLPLTGYLDSKGRHVHMQVPMTISSLTALDREDLYAALNGTTSSSTHPAGSVQIGGGGRNLNDPRRLDR